MVIKLIINRKAGAAHLMRPVPVQNVIYISDRNKTKPRQLPETVSVTGQTDTVTDINLLDITPRNVIDRTIKVRFESEKKRNLYLLTPPNQPASKPSSAIPGDDDRDR